MLPIICINDSYAQGRVEIGKVYYCKAESMELVGGDRYLLHIYYSKNNYSKSDMLNSNRFKPLQSIKVEDLL